MKKPSLVNERGNSAFLIFADGIGLDLCVSLDFEGVCGIVLPNIGNSTAKKSASSGTHDRNYFVLWRNRFDSYEDQLTLRSALASGFTAGRA